MNEQGELTYKELAEQLIFEGYFMPEFSWQQYEEDLRWDLHIDEKELERYAKEHNISLIVEKEEDLKILLSIGEITLLTYLRELRKLMGEETPYRKKSTEEEKRTGNTPRMRAYCYNHGL